MDFLSAGDRHDGGELVEPDHHGAARQPAGAAAAGHRLAALAAFQRARRRQVEPPQTIHFRSADIRIGL